MNKMIYRVAKLTNNIPLDWLIKSSQKRNILPFYHTVSDQELIHVKHLYRVKTVKCFEKDLDLFLKYYKAIDYKTFKANLETNQPRKEKTFLLSFDDGLREFHDIIAPILIRKGIPALCFLNSGFIDNKDLFFRFKASILIEKLIKGGSFQGKQVEIKKWFIDKGLSLNDNYKSLRSIDYLNKHYLDELAEIINVDFNDYLRTVKPYMDTIQIKNLINQGFEFGAHSIDHPLFSNLQKNQQLIQLNQSMEDIALRFDLKYKLFSFPFTDYGVTLDFFKSVFENESPIADLTFGSAGLKNDSYKKNIQRIAIERENYTAKEILYAEYIYYHLKALINKNTIRRS